MLYEMRMRKPELTCLPTQGLFNPPHHIGMVGEELAFDDAVSYTQRGKQIAAQLNVMAVTGFVRLSSGSPTPCLNQLSYLPTTTG